MHIPGHFTPFSQSLMNRGMKQTNNNIGNINNPNENIMGGGMQPGGPIFQETGISTGFGDSEMGIINPVQPSYEPEGVKSPLFSEGSMAAGFDVNNDGVVDMLDYAYAQEQGQPGTGAPIGDSFYDWLLDTQYQGEVAGFVDWWSSFNQEQQNEFSSAWQNQLEYGSGPYEQGFLDNLMQFITPQQSTAQQFTGGGGQAGSSARRLYYPGTSGGFAGVGSGIGGGNTLQELLKQYQG